MTTRNLDAALKLARRGVPVFPCRADKVPLVKLGPGFKDATANPDLIKEWWSKWPDALVSVRTGIKFAVLDIDCAKHVEAAQWYGKADLPITRTHITRSGGRHLLFQPDERFRCTTSRICRGVDTKGINGCAIWWPACGFEVLLGDVLAPVPEWLIRQLEPPPPIEVPATTNSRSSCSASIRGALCVLAGAKEGERNAALFWTSCRMGEAVRQGTISESEALAMLTAVGRQVGLQDYEIVPTARSGMREGVKS
jgi:bifunctional DNA primase/polymerase-like protein